MKTSLSIFFLMLSNCVFSQIEFDYFPDNGLNALDTIMLKNILNQQNTRRYTSEEVLMESDIERIISLNTIKISTDSVKGNETKAIFDSTIIYIFRQLRPLYNPRLDNKTYFVINLEQEPKLLIKYKEKESQLCNFIENLRGKKLERVYMISFFPDNKYDAFYYKEREKKHGYYVNDKDLQYFDNFNSLIEYKFGSIDNYIKIYDTRNTITQIREKEREDLLKKRDLRITLKLMDSCLP